MFDALLLFTFEFSLVDSAVKSSVFLLGFGVASELFESMKLYLSAGIVCSSDSGLLVS